VKLLSVGQPIQGTVKRITEFGAFVDIGVGRDGLVHISELSTTRVAKVNDVLSEGQEFTFWIKKLDRDRNRISLTLIEPGQRTIRDLQVGEVVEGTVTRILPYGAFIDIGVGRDALLHVREMAEGFVAKPEDVAAYKVGVQTGTTQDTWLTDLVNAGTLPEANLFRYDRADQVAMDVKNGRIDVMMSDLIPAQALAKQLGGLKIVYSGVLSSGPMNIVIPNGDVELQKAINEIIKQLQDEGFIDQLAVKYFSEQ